MIGEPFESATKRTGKVGAVPVAEEARQAAPIVIEANNRCLLKRPHRSTLATRANALIILPAYRRVYREILLLTVSFDPEMQHSIRRATCNATGLINIKKRERREGLGAAPLADAWKVP